MSEFLVTLPVDGLPIISLTRSLVHSRLPGKIFLGNRGQQNELGRTDGQFDCQLQDTHRDCSDKNIDFSEKDEFRMLNFNGKLIGIGKVVSGISSSFKKIEIRPQKIFN